MQPVQLLKFASLVRASSTLGRTFRRLQPQRLFRRPTPRQQTSAEVGRPIIELVRSKGWACACLIWTTYHPHV